jgi:inner membrane protease subunit 1
VPEGHCWLLGDNLPASRDSRAYGPVPLALVKGKVVARVWPWRDRKWIENSLQSPEFGGVE